MPRKYQSAPLTANQVTSTTRAGTPVIVEVKSFFSSLTVWANIFFFIAPEIVFVLEEVLRENIIDYPGAANWILKIIAIINIGLRLRTKAPVTINP